MAIRARSPQSEYAHRDQSQPSPAGPRLRTQSLAPHRAAKRPRGASAAGPERFPSCSWGQCALPQVEFQGWSSEATPTQCNSREGERPREPKLCREVRARADARPPGGGSGDQGVDQLIWFVRQRRAHVSLNYQASTLNHSGGLFSVAPILRPPARQHKPRNRAPRRTAALTHSLLPTMLWPCERKTARIPHTPRQRRRG